MTHKTYLRAHVEYPDFARAFHHCNDALWDAYRRHHIDLDMLRSERFYRLLTQLGVPGMAVAIPAVAARFEYELGRCVELFADSLAALRALRRAARLVLVTDGIAAVQHAKLARARLRALFDHVVISSEVGYRKPDPALLSHALRCAGADRAAALVVGDSPASDGAGAHAAGIDFCWVNRSRGNRRPGPAGQPAARFQVPDLAALAARLAPRGTGRGTLAGGGRRHAG